MATVLELEGVSKAFGELVVIADLDLVVDEGEAVGVVGPNGAGKTTMLNLTAGSMAPDSGRVLFRGEDVTRYKPHRHCRAGIARTFQVPRPFRGMTVYENVLVAATYGAGTSGAQRDALAAETLERTRLTARANALAGSLTLLQRKQLELARAWATRPDVLLLDEIGGGLTEAELDDLVATIGDLRATGVAIVWIEHIVHALLSVVDRLVAIAAGRKLLDGDPKEVMASAELRDVYLGEDPL
ncbi:MAG: branched-chain amino acid transport system ATP-binding protein [Solirubrobacteraceae bacterium]